MCQTCLNRGSKLLRDLRCALAAYSTQLMVGQWPFAQELDMAGSLIAAAK